LINRNGSERILVFELDIPIRWGDMDAMGHVNNTVYFRYLEELRIRWFDAMGFAPDPAGQGPVIVSAHCDFIRELRYPGTVRCRHYTGAIGNSSFETFGVLSRTDDPDTVYAEGGARVVWVDFPKRKSSPLPESARRAIVTPIAR
jgi:acyl-CoA thioester hydrolase